MRTLDATLTSIPHVAPPSPAVRVLSVIPGTGEGSSFIFARNQVRSLAADGFELETIFFDQRLSLSGVLRNWNRVRRSARQMGADIVHAHYGTVTALVCALAVRVPLVVTFQGSDLNPEPGIGWLRTRLGLLLSQCAAFRANAIICVSSQLAGRLWWRHKRVSIVPAGVNLELFKPMPKARARELLGWDVGERVVLLNAGRAPVVKGLDLALAAMASVSSRAENIRLEVMNGQTEPDCVPLLLNASDCLLVTSRSEGSPNIVKEAMACNLPVVSVDVGDVAERLVGVSPSRVVTRDPDAIANALMEVVALEARSNGRMFVSDLSEDHIAARVRSIYASMRAQAACESKSEIVGK